MSGKLVISKRKNNIVTAFINDGELIEVESRELDNPHIIGNIYIGKVKNILKNINAAFIDVGLEKNVYLSLDKNKNILFDANKKLRVGDEVVVQIIKESSKTKGPVATCHLNLTGRYVVLTVKKNYIGISNKINDEMKRLNLKKIVKPFLSNKFGFIIRTNAIFADEKLILEELKMLIDRYNYISKVAKYRACYQLIEKAPSPFITFIRDQYKDQIDVIVVDDNEVYNEIYDYLFNYQKEDLKKLKMYNDDNLSLFDLHGLKTKITQGLKPKVWLKSGGYIVISPTEALIAIDVNTGKYAKKKEFEQVAYKTNLEAAKEIAKQLRLRNLSGIIIVDFIDMKKKEYKEHLLVTFEEFLKKDPIKTIVIGMTSLNLVELTRKKAKKPIYEQFGKRCNKCSGIGYIYSVRDSD